MQNIKDINYLIGALTEFKDAYSLDVKAMLTDYLIHKDYKQFRAALETAIPCDGIAFHNRWNFDIKDVFHEVVYP